MHVIASQFADAALRSLNFIARAPILLAALELRQASCRKACTISQLHTCCYSYHQAACSACLTCDCMHELLAVVCGKSQSFWPTPASRLPGKIRGPVLSPKRFSSCIGSGWGCFVFSLLCLRPSEKLEILFANSRPGKPSSRTEGVWGSLKD